jgi:hypothetical protein
MLIAHRFQVLVSIAFVATLMLVVRAVMAQPAPKPFTVTTAGLQVIYPSQKPGRGESLIDAHHYTTGGLAVVYPTAPPSSTRSLQAFKVTTDGLKVVYPSPTAIPKGK